MAYLRDTYSLFKDTVSETEKDIIALMKEHMQICIRPYHALIPQLDLIGLNGESVLRMFCLRTTSVRLSRRERAGGGKVIKRIQNTQTKLDLDNNHLWKLTHWLRDLLQGALNKGKPQQQPTEAAPSRIHLLLDLRTLKGALNKRV
jgi:hypothetical protein